MKMTFSAALVTGAVLLSACATLVPPSRAQDTSSEGTWTEGTVPPAEPASAPVPAKKAAAPLKTVTEKTPPKPPTAAQEAGTPPPPEPTGFTPVGLDKLIKFGDEPESAAGAGINQGPAVAQLGIKPAKATPALASFKTSCSSLVRRPDRTGLVPAENWKPACNAAKTWPSDDAVSFFTTHFETVQVGAGQSFATGYFEPEILGSRFKSERYSVPVYRRPANLVDVDLGLFSEELKGKRVRGKVVGSKLKRFEHRKEIEDGALDGQGLEIAWAADDIEFFFLQIQGSGRLRLPDGSVIRIGYNGQNGHDYVGIGRVMKKRGLLAPGKSNLDGIVEWLRANPAEGREIMRLNGSYIFFRELTGPGPLGAMGHPVVGRTSVAADPRYVPLGAPIWMDAAHDVADGLWIAQDTGGAIKGANRFDTFWGAGAQARQIAGGMASRGKALIFLPKGSFNRLLQSRGGSDAADITPAASSPPPSER